MIERNPNEIDLSRDEALPLPEEQIRKATRKMEFASMFRTLDQFGEYKPEEENPDVLIKGRWLERGGSAWWISTAGTGKSIVERQFALSLAAGIPFAGLYPNQSNLVIWIFQSEDSDSRIIIDREDIMAQLKEDFPSVQWGVVKQRVKFVNSLGVVGEEWLAKLNTLLEDAKCFNQSPDILILNPFLAFVGGSITDGSFVTPFLRGGEINGKQIIGLQQILEKHKCGVIIFHHTPKPPNTKELAAWLKSPMPEYQGAGASDITNWGRSFITMMKIPSKPRTICLTAGKNGSELGWEEVDGARQHFLAWSDALGVSGGARHAWRELTEDEHSEILGREKTTTIDELEVMLPEVLEDIKRNGAANRMDFYGVRFSAACSRRTDRLRLFSMIEDRYASLKLQRRAYLRGKTHVLYYGYANGFKAIALESKDVTKLEEIRRQNKERREWEELYGEHPDD